MSDPPPAAEWTTNSTSLSGFQVAALGAAVAPAAPGVEVAGDVAAGATGPFVGEVAAVVGWAAALVGAVVGAGAWAVPQAAATTVMASTTMGRTRTLFLTASFLL